MSATKEKVWVIALVLWIAGLVWIVCKDADSLELTVLKNTLQLPSEFIKQVSPEESLAWVYLLLNYDVQTLRLAEEYQLSGELVYVKDSHLVTLLFKNGICYPAKVNIVVQPLTNNDN